MTSLVSIIIPTYNRQEFIKDAINCAINQYYHNIEIIIVDNCSTDNTMSVVEDFANKDKRIKYFKNNENIGPVNNWKKCIDIASGDFVKILWSDDLIEKDFISDSIKLFDNKTAFVLTGYEIQDFLSKKALYRSKFQYRNYTTKEYLKQAIVYTTIDFPLSPGCAIFRLNDLKKAFITKIQNNEGLDSTKNGAGNDLLLMLNIASYNDYNKIKCINKFSAIYRSHFGSFSVSNKLDLYYEYARLHFFISTNIKTRKFLTSYIYRLYYLSFSDKKFNIIKK